MDDMAEEKDLDQEEIIEEGAEADGQTGTAQEEGPGGEAEQPVQDGGAQDPDAAETAQEEGAAEEEPAAQDGRADAEAAEEQPEEAAADDGAQDGGEAKEKKGFFSRKKDKKDDALKTQIAELQDRVMRQMAEFENFRKRTDKEKSAMYETGARSVIEKILPVVDNFERGLAMVPEEQKSEPFVDGMTKIYKQFLKELENLGVKPIEAVGKPFDPDLHNAVMQVENDELESGTVAQELQKGYMYRDTVVRHSLVAVVQ